MAKERFFGPMDENWKSEERPGKDNSPSLANMVLVAQPTITDIRKEIIIERPEEEEHTIIRDKSFSMMKTKNQPRKRMTDVEIRRELGTVTPMAKSKPGLKMKANLTLKNSGSVMSLPKKKFQEDRNDSPLRVKLSGKLSDV